MRKLLVLIFVLGMSSFVNAAIVLSVNGDTSLDEITINVGDTVTIDVDNTGQMTPVDFNLYVDFYYLSEGTYALSNARLGPQAGDFPATLTGPYQPGSDNDEFWINQSWAVGSPEVPGVVFLVDVECVAAGDVLVELWDERMGFGAPVDTMTIHQVPEPMMLSLLGLGGLLLRKRRAA